MTIGNVFEYCSVFGSMIGSVYVARKNRLGYMIFMISFAPASAFAVYYSHWGLLILYVYFLVVNCYGWYNWRKQ